MSDQYPQFLERLLNAPATGLRDALTYSANVIADALHADKVDAFLYDESRDSLVAVGVSTQPLSELQRRLGLDVLPVSNGGRAVHVFRTGRAFSSGDLSNDLEELRGIREGLKVQSQIGIPLEVAGHRRGLVMIASLEADYFAPADEAFAQSVMQWIGIVAHRAELVEELERNAVEQGRRDSAEGLVTVLAHDLRNYLSPVVSRLYLLRHRAEADERTEDLTSINAALQGLSDISSLVSDLLDVARIDRGLFALDSEPIDLVSLTKEVAGSLSTPAHEIVVNTTGSVLAFGDSRRIRQCLQNVLANAITHSPENAPVRVAISRDIGKGETWAHLQIEDQGPGIPEEILPHIFERFRTNRERSGGLGLGLYLARQIAVAHGGDLAADSPPGGGTRFLITLRGHTERAGSCRDA